MARQVYHYFRYKARESARVMAVGIQSAEEIRAQLDFPFFCEWVTRETAEPKVQPDHMKVWNELILTEKSSSCLIGIAGQNTSIRAPRGSAKAQPVDEPVLTPDGWVRMGDLKAGDFVVSGDGKPTQITGVHPQGIKQSYRVTFTDGSFTECSDDHLWTVRNLAGGNPREFKTRPLNHLRTKVFVRSGGSKPGQVVTTYRDAEPDETPWLDYRGYAKYHIPIVAPIEFSPQKLPYRSLSFRSSDWRWELHKLKRFFFNRRFRTT